MIDPELVAALSKARREREETARQMRELVDFLQVAGRRWSGRTVSEYGAGWVDCANTALNWVGKHAKGSPELQAARRRREVENRCEF